MTNLMEKAFKEVQKLPTYVQDELAQQLLEDIHNELQWQKTLSNPDIDLEVLARMAQEALIEEQEGKTEGKGFGEG
jgi:CHASE3 domain sensor protein